MKLRHIIIITAITILLTACNFTLAEDVTPPPGYASPTPAPTLGPLYPAGNPDDSLNVIGYSSAQTLEHVLRKAGDDLTRANVMKIAGNLSLTQPMLYPGIDIKTGPDDFYPVEKMQPQQFDGTRYVPLGPVLGR